MFTVSKKAGEMMTEFMRQREKPSSIRILLKGGGCAGSSLGLALDEATPNDEIFEHDGVSYIVEKGLFSEVQHIAVEYVESPYGNGFQVQSNLKMESGCGSCYRC
jgi:iron-sulfur cluster assembly accessory protein